METIIAVCKKEIEIFDTLLGKKEWTLHHSHNDALFFLNLDITKEEIQVLKDNNIPINTDDEYPIFDQDGITISRWQESDWYNLIIYQEDGDSGMIHSVSNALNIPIKDE